jgi:hypothetical protein
VSSFSAIAAMYRTSNRDNYESDSDEDSFDEDEDYGHRYNCKPQWKHAEATVAKTLKGTFTVTSGRTSAGQIRIRYGKWHIVFISVSYSELQVRIVFVVYRIHIFAPEYEYILNIFKYILATLAPKKSVELC